MISGSICMVTVVVERWSPTVLVRSCWESFVETSWDRLRRFLGAITKSTSPCPNRVEDEGNTGNSDQVETTTHRLDESDLPNKLYPQVDTRIHEGLSLSHCPDWRTGWKPPLRACIKQLHVQLGLGHITAAKRMVSTVVLIPNLHQWPERHMPPRYRATRITILPPVWVPARIHTHFQETLATPQHRQKIITTSKNKFLYELKQFPKDFPASFFAVRNDTKFYKQITIPKFFVIVFESIFHWLIYCKEKIAVHLF